MIPLPFFHDLPIAILGLGRSGLQAAKALLDSGAEVWAWDDDAARRADAEAAGVPIRDLSKVDLREATTLLLSPGIPHSFPAPHPIVAAAKAAGLEVIGDIELLGRACPAASFIGLTGTNGKSTTTALVGHILRLGGLRAEVGGNLGVAALSLQPLESGGFYVLEMSSYQLELTLSITFDVAVLLNISPDHLERHGGLEGYVAAKRKIFHRQTKPRVAILGIDDPDTAAIHAEMAAADEQRVIAISAKRVPAGGVGIEGGWLIDDLDGTATPAIDLASLPRLPGAHNAQNAAAAYAVCRAIGLSGATVAACMASFEGLEHRQELVAEIDGITFVNDSKATNVEAATKALACYPHIYLIAGGRAKGESLEPLLGFSERLCGVYLIGEAAESFAEALGESLPVKLCGTLDAAIAQAARDARAEGREGATVLLSPACASFDQFDDFEARGAAFKALVAALPGARRDVDSVSLRAGGGLQ